MVAHPAARIRVQVSASLLVALLVAAAGACSDPVQLVRQPRAAGGSGAGQAGAGGAAGGLQSAVVINELVSSNDGVMLDELGEADDLIELYNASAEVVTLAGFALSDQGSLPYPLPDRELEARAALVLWADDSPEQGQLHLPFKLSADGDAVLLWSPAGQRLQTVMLPALETNLTYARFPDGLGEFEICRYATPGRENGAGCGPPPPPELEESFAFTPYSWSLPYPGVAGPLVVTELALRPAGFVELVNLGEEAVSLDDYDLRVAPTAPGTEFPGATDGVAIALPPGTTLAAEERLAVDVTADDVAELDADSEFEGVLGLYRRGESEPLERIDFMSWPSGATLARQPDPRGRHIFCATATPGEPNELCDPLPNRPVGDRLRHLRTAGDFSALAEGAVQLGMAPVKFVLDLQQHNALHLLSSRAWDLHYTFVREVINQEPHLDRCDPAERAAFNSGWQAFSLNEYYDPDARRYLQGTLVHHGGADLFTVEFALGDLIRADHMQQAFFRAMEHVLDPARWALRPQDASQAQTALAVDGNLPIVDPNAPFRGVTFQPLTEGTAYGVLRFIPTAQLGEARLGLDTIVVTDDVPNDIPLVGGLITEAFQTPLAHVNVLSQARGTPNLSLVSAREDPRLAPHFDTLVQLEVTGGGFSLQPADPEQAQAYWDSRRPTGPRVSPRLDLSVRELQPLDQGSLELLPVVGAKAAQLAELGRVPTLTRYGCTSTTAQYVLPAQPFAVPVVHFVEHFESSGARALLEQLQADPEFVADPLVRAEGLEQVRDLILTEPVEAGLLAEVEAAVRARFGTRRVRLRSSSNAEDLSGFNGAGLYTSTSAEAGNPERSIEDALRVVWSSLYNARAYDERELARIDHSGVAMGVLVHEAFLSERANGVAISRNVLNPIRSDIYYFNTQIGEASVTNPAPGVVTEQFMYRWPPRMPPIIYQTESSLTGGEPVLSLEEVERVACSLYSINAHFRPLLDPDGEDAWFAMEIEFKLVGQDRQLVIKQTRPHAFGGFELIEDCREL